VRPRTPHPLQRLGRRPERLPTRFATGSRQYTPRVPGIASPSLSPVGLWRRSRKTATAVAAAALILASGTTVAQTTLVGRVIGVTDGDTVTLLDGANKQHHVRLAGIDAPERGQPGAYRSKDSLARLVREQVVRVEWHKRDQFDRIVGAVWVASPDSPCRGKPDCPMTLDAGLAQITMGRAWWFRRFAHEQSPQDRGRYESAEQEARSRKAGLWRDGSAVPPWEWREKRQGANRPSAGQASGPRVAFGPAVGD
jgi:endonuclease YncB( thermonuclease family)